MKNKKYSEDGSVLLEALVVTSIFLIIILGLAGTLSFIVKASLANVMKIQASYLAEEGLEAVRLLRDASWAMNIAGEVSGVPFYLNFNGSSWVKTAVNTYVDETFERKTTFSDVYRDSSQNIVSSGGTLDPNIKKVTVAVYWNSYGATTTRSLSTYITNVFSN